MGRRQAWSAVWIPHWADPTNLPSMLGRRLTTRLGNHFRGALGPRSFDQLIAGVLRSFAAMIAVST